MPNPTAARPNGQPKGSKVPPGAERRTYTVRYQTRPGSHRDGEPDGLGRLSGYAALFNEESQDLGGFIEVIRPGAFRRAIREDDVRALFNHDSNYVIGRTKSGTLVMEEDDRGLSIVVDPPRAQWAADLMESIRRGDVDQMSFAFATVKDRWTNRGDQVIRELLDVRLFDVSPVTYPAYLGTTISAEVQARAAVLSPRADPRDPNVLRARLDAKERAYWQDRHREKHFRLDRLSR